MGGLRGLLLAIRFLLELALIVSLAYWGLRLDTGLAVRLIAGLGAAVVAIGVWGRWVAPKAPRQLEDPARFVVEVVLFACAAIGLGHGGQWMLGVLLFSVYVVDRIALTMTGGTGS
jgi:hypothetical protein